MSCVEIPMRVEQVKGCRYHNTLCVNTCLEEEP